MNKFLQYIIVDSPFICGEPLIQNEKYSILSGSDPLKPLVISQLHHTSRFLSVKLDSHNGSKYYHPDLLPGPVNPLRSTA